MANFSLNEVLKAKAAQGQQARTGEEEMALDDIARVKVLSPARQVFKRFIRNRLAVFGSVVLITMFVFSFIGPLFYAYGQKQIFYKYDTRNVRYAMCTETQTYTDYVIDDSIVIENLGVESKMNSNIKWMLGADIPDDPEGISSIAVIGENGKYVIDRVSDSVYQLSQAELELVGSVGHGKNKLTIGVYDSIVRQFSDEQVHVYGLLDKLKTEIKKTSKNGSFSFEGNNYIFTKSSVGQGFTIEVEYEDIFLSDDELGDDFARMADPAKTIGNAFEYEGEQYVLERTSIDSVAANKVQGNERYTEASYRIYRRGESTPAKLYSCLTASTIAAGTDVSKDFIRDALHALGNGGSFSHEGQNWTVTEEDGLLIVRDEQGQEFMELSPYSVKRYTGFDSMDYDLKKIIIENAEEMQENNEKERKGIVYRLPQQNEEGEYEYDADGNLLYADSELSLISEPGGFVVNADQVIYVIQRFEDPSWQHILGTDGDGFDVFARIMYGGRVSLMVGFVVVFLEIFLGVIMGGLAGYYGGWVDMVIMRLVDIFYCLPSMPIMIILGAMMDAQRMDTYLRLMIMMAALGIMGWAGVARMVRGQILSLREQEFMVATEATGIKVRDRIFHHLVPNVMPQLIVIATMGMGGVILTESTLSFLGLGVKHPLATWGTMINSVSSSSAMAHYAHIWIPVGLLICLTVIAFNFVGDGLRDAYDPKAKR